MAEDLQGLLERINKDGIEKAGHEKKAIIDAAHAEAKEIVSAAKAQAKKLIEEANHNAEKLVEKGESALAQASRDVIIALKKSMESALELALEPVVKSAMGPATLSNIIETMVKGFVANKFSTDHGINVYLSEEDCKALESASFAAFKEQIGTSITLFPIKGVSGGVQIGVNGTDARFDISDETVKEMICAYLNPQMVKIVK
ncbi:MAG: hypothetical protein ACRC37_06545 [Lentisphaeria bacterium]